MRILQDSFYVPLRRVGSPRFIAVVGCFAGSALLHCIPQLISTDLKDAVMMGSFFLIHGFLVLSEIGLKEALRGRLVRGQSSNGLVSALVAATAPATSSSSSSSTSLRRRRAAHTAAKAKEAAEEGVRRRAPTTSTSAASSYQWAVELGAATLSLLSLYLARVEGGRPGPAQALCVVVLAILTSAGVIYVHRAEIRRAALSEVDGAVEDEGGALLNARLRVHALWTLAGWAWQLTAIIVTLPLFSTPVFNAMRTVYRHSFVVGPLLRAWATK